jgi:hypothetical protein
MGRSVVGGRGENARKILNVVNSRDKSTQCAGDGTATGTNVEGFLADGFGLLRSSVVCLLSLAK